MQKSRLALAVVLVVLAVAVVTSACSLLSGSSPTPTVTPITSGPQATAQATSETIPQAANALEAQIVSVYDVAAPAVVNVTSQIVTRNFFGQPVPQQGTGSGFVYDMEGHIVTNYHVVQDATSVSVTLPGKQSQPATIVGVDPSTDLAVLSIPAQDLPTPLPLGDSNRLRVGQFVVAIGNPFGLNGTLTLGVVSALGRVIQSPDGSFLGEALQQDASVNPGNSGGPLLNLSGQVVGVNSQIISPSGASAGIGFAICSCTVSKIVPELIARGKYPHPWLGVQEALDLTPDIAAALRNAGMQLSVDSGVLIVEMAPGSPGATAGIQGGSRRANISGTIIALGGDVIVAINGETITSSEDLAIYLDLNTKVGDKVNITLMRGDQKLTVDVTLAERPQTQQSGF